MLRVLNHGRVAAEIPAHAMAEEGPSIPAADCEAAGAGANGPLVEFGARGRGPDGEFPAIARVARDRVEANGSPSSTIRWCARTRRVGPGAGDAAVVRLKESKRALALATDGNGRWGVLDPRVGAMHAVAEAARNVACTGARPIAATNCLNFGNPEKPEVMWQFSRGD